MKKILLVGTGLTNAVLYTRLKELQQDIEIEVIEKRPHIGGNCYDEKEEDYFIHTYGPHIFHTNKKKIWDFVNQFADFKPYINQAMATDLEHTYPLPYNMNTFTKIWPNLTTPAEVKAQIQKEIDEYYKTHEDKHKFSDVAIRKVGTTVFNKLIKEYTEKQWHCDCDELSPSIIERLPVRLSYNNNYFNDTYQGLPVGGYTAMIEKMFAGAKIKLNTDFIKDGYISRIGDYDRIYYSGPIDELYSALNPGKKTEVLPYRSLRFEEVVGPTQGVFVLTYDTKKVPYTRVNEPVQLTREPSSTELVKKFYEYPVDYEYGKNDPYYPINNTETDAIWKVLSLGLPSNIRPVGRLGKYRYFNMDAAIEEALKEEL